VCCVILNMFVLCASVAECCAGFAFASVQCAAFARLRPICKSHQHTHTTAHTHKLPPLLLTHTTPSSFHLAITIMASDIFYRIECSVRESRMQFYMRFREPKLYRYARAMEYEKIVDRCFRNPKAAAREAKFRHDYAPHSTTLHRVLEPLFLLGDVGKVEIDTMQQLVEQRHKAAVALLEANPSSALVTCVFGSTPLDMACLDPHVCIDDVDSLISTCPKCVFHCDSKEGWNALHYACVTNKSNAKLIQRLVEHCPEGAAKQEASGGRLPLHHAAAAPPSFSNDEVAKKFAQESLRTPPVTEAVMKLLLHAHEPGASVRDADGLAPLHYLCRYLEACAIDKITADLLRACLLLVKAEPRILFVPDEKKQGHKTPIAVLGGLRQNLEEAATSGQEHFDECIRILREFTS